MAKSAPQITQNADGSTTYVEQTEDNITITTTKNSTGSITEQTAVDQNGVSVDVPQDYDVGSEGGKSNEKDQDSGAPATTDELSVEQHCARVSDNIAAFASHSSDFGALKSYFKQLVEKLGEDEVLSVDAVKRLGGSTRKLAR